MIKAADLFCGAGGMSTGLIQACQELGFDVDLLAINHWQVAISTHRKNHPQANHLCESMDNVDPRKAVPGGRLNILVASPECTHHSNARGGKPRSEQSRASGFHILRWAEALYVENIFIENVKEFVDWGPIGADGKPLKSKKGAMFRAFCLSLEALSYRVDWRIVNCADYGDPTTRRRFFLQARRGNRKIAWPEPTHTIDGHETLFGKSEKWLAARECIDWELKGQSIFRRKKPLKPNTIARIAHGLKKFGGPAADPFLVMLYGTGKSRSVERPMPTVTANGQHIGLCEPFIMPIDNGSNGPSGARDIDSPLPTIIASKSRLGLVEPFITILKGQSNVRSVDDPLPTLTTNPHLYLCEPFMVTMKGKKSMRSVDKPMATITTIPGIYLCEPFLVKYNGTGKAQSVDRPIDTITTKDRFGLVQTEAGEEYQLDITFRMLQPHELAAAMSFPRDYQFAGTQTEQVKQIGNAVPRKTAKAHIECLLAS